MDDRFQSPDNDNTPEEPVVFIVTGRAEQGPDTQLRPPPGEPQGTPVHVLLIAPDEDAAVRLTLDALSERGFAKAELERIGTVDAPPDEEPHASAYQGALEGEVAIILFS